MSGIDNRKNIVKRGACISVRTQETVIHTIKVVVLSVIGLFEDVLRTINLPKKTLKN